MHRDDATSLGRAETTQPLPLSCATCHGLITAAAGSGRTVSLQAMVEGFSLGGVPVFVADLKGDLSGISQPGGASTEIGPRAARAGSAPAGCPTVFWDLLAEQGHPLRLTVSDLGALLLARLLGLNETQGAVLAIAFRVADDRGLLLLDLKDLRALLHFLVDHASELSLHYGRLPVASVAAIQRRLTILEQQGGRRFLGEPALAVADLVRRDAAGRGVVNLLAADRLPSRLCSSFLLWLLAELCEALPEAGELERPRLALFLDEAPLLFERAPPALLAGIGEAVRRIRSRGVAVWLVAPGPEGVPGEVLAELGQRVAPAAGAADGTAPGIGEALVSGPEEGGAPGPTERTLLAPPRSRLGPVTAEERRALMAVSPLAGRYEASLERAAAHALLARRVGSGRAARRAAAAGMPPGIGRPIGRPIRRGPLGSLARR